MATGKSLLFFPFLLFGTAVPGVTQAKAGSASPRSLYEIPKNGCVVVRFPDKKGRYPKIEWTAYYRKGHCRRSRSGARIYGANPSSGAKVYFPKSEKSFVQFDFKFISPDENESIFVKGKVASEGVCRVDILKGLGFGTSFAWGKSKAVYGNKEVTAEGKAALAVTTVGTPKSVGGGVSVLGSGGSFQTSWVSDLPQARKALFDDFDSAGEEETDSAVVGMGTAGTATLTLMGHAVGYSSFEAYSACLLCVHLRGKVSAPRGTSEPR